MPNFLEEQNFISKKPNDIRMIEDQIAGLSYLIKRRLLKVGFNVVDFKNIRNFIIQGHNYESNDLKNLLIQRNVPTEMAEEIVKEIDLFSFIINYVLNK